MPDTLNAGQSLNIGQQLQSNNGRYVLLMQDDGNLVLYEGVPSVASARWGSNTFNLFPLNPVRADMQPDGNFVLVTAINVPVWATQTHGNPGSKLVLQDDRDLVIYAPDGRALWSSNTPVPAGAPAAAPITAVSPPPGSPDAQRGWGLQVGWNKFITTNATLYRDGRLIGDVYSECRAPFSALRARVLIVCVDDAGRAIWVSEDFDAGTACAFLDPSCASFRRETFAQNFPAVVGQYTQRLDIYAGDTPSFADLRQKTIEGIRAAGDIAREVKDQFLGVFGP